MNTIDPETRDKAYQYFSQEALEFLQVIEEGLLNLQADHSVPQIHNLMRAAHSIKGGASSIGLPAIEHISHRLEDIFRALYSQEHEIDRDIEEILLQAYDCLRVPLVEQIQTGSHDAEAAIEHAEPIFAVIVEFLGDSFGADVELPTSAELGFDIAQVVFSSDVTQGLDRLEKVLEHPEIEQVVGEIRAQAEVFSGIGELLNLPGFSEIAKQTILALDANPNEAVLVGQVAIANFKKAQELVLAGDRDRGGEPSEALLMLTSHAVESLSDLSVQSTENPTQNIDSESNLVIGSSSSFEAAFEATVAQEESQAENSKSSPSPFFVELTEELKGSFGDLFEDPIEFSTNSQFFEESEESIGEVTEASDRFFEERPETSTDNPNDFFKSVLFEELTDSSQDFFEELTETSFFETASQLPDGANAGTDREPSIDLIEQDDLPKDVEPAPLIEPETFAEKIPQGNAQDCDNDADELFEQLEEMYSVETEEGVEDALASESLAVDAPEDLDSVVLPETSSLDFSMLGDMFGSDSDEDEPPDITSFILANDSDEMNLLQAIKADVADLADPQSLEPITQTPLVNLNERNLIEPQNVSQSQNEEKAIDLKIANLLDPRSPEVIPSEISKPTSQLEVQVKTSLPGAPVSSIQVTTAKEVQSRSDTTVTPQLSEAIRVDLSRLERINNLAGELVTQENSSSLQSQQLQGMLLNLQRRSEHFDELTKKLQSWIDSSQKSEVRSQRPTGADVEQPKSTSSYLGLLPDLATFDPLLMDSYSYIYTLVQESVEEIAQMGETIRDMDLLSMQTQNTQRKKQQTLKQLRNDLLWARMMPLNEILSRFPRMVRDLSIKYNKQVKLTIGGGNTLVDKAILEKLYDPLVHLIRNAFDHGTEPAHVRVQQGKPPEATIELRAYHRGNQTFVEIRDDGRGIDPEKVRASAIAKGVLSPSEPISQDRAYELLFSPSFSTAEKVSELSGRGVGLTSVREQIVSLKGNVTIDSVQGKGTIFTIRLPLTLTTAKLLVFSIGSNLMAIPVDTLLTIVTASDDQIQTIQGQQYYRYQDELVPLYPQSAFVHQYPLPKSSNEQIRSMSLPIADKVPLLIIAAGNQMLALEVDQIFNEQELVIKPFGKAIAPPSYLYGCTILGDGSLVPVVDGLALVAKWLKPTIVKIVYSEPVIQTPLMLAAESYSSTGATNDTVPSPEESVPLIATPPILSTATILVVDDSLTARQTLSMTLTKYGYRVVQAIDGRDALEKLKQNPDIQAAFCDVEMPRMNGFEFLNQFRNDYPNSKLPIIMLTSRGGEKHRSLATLFGASGYLTKPYLEHDLLKTLQLQLKPRAESFEVRSQPAIAAPIQIPIPKQVQAPPSIPEVATAVKAPSSVISHEALDRESSKEKIPSSSAQRVSLPIILVIDDSLTARQTLSITLAKYGYRVVQAIDGIDALDKIKQEPDIQAAFCDIEMPRMNGFEFLNQFRNDHPTSRLPIIMLTSRGSEKHRSLATLFGASGYLTKPYLETELLKTLQSKLLPLADPKV